MEILHAILCAVKRQVSVAHRLCFISLEGSTALEDRTPAGSLKGRLLTEGRPSWKTGPDFKGWQEFAGGWVFCWRTASMEDRTLLEDALSCTSLCKNVVSCVCMCCVWLQRKHYFNINGYCYSVCSQEAHIFAIYRLILYSVTGWQDLLRAGLWRTGFCWRTWSLDERTLLECTEMYISLFI